VAAIEALRDTELADLPPMLFREIEPQDVKQWGEQQILQPYNCVAMVNQAGQITVRRFGTPPFRDEALVVSNVVRAAA
jgi:hypothetical protein